MTLNSTGGKIVSKGGSLAGGGGCCCGCSGWCDEEWGYPCEQGCKCCNGQCIDAEKTCCSGECDEDTPCPDGCYCCGGRCVPSPCRYTPVCDAWTGYCKEGAEGPFADKSQCESEWGETCPPPVGCCQVGEEFTDLATQEDCEAAGGQWFSSCGSACSLRPPRPWEYGYNSFFNYLPSGAIQEVYVSSGPYGFRWKPGYPQKLGCKPYFVWIEYTTTGGDCNHIRWRERVFVWDCANQQFAKEEGALDYPQWSPPGGCDDPANPNSVTRFYKTEGDSFSMTIEQGLPFTSPPWGPDRYPEGTPCKQGYRRCEEYVDPGPLMGDPVFDCSANRIAAEANPLP